MVDKTNGAEVQVSSADVEELIQNPEPLTEVTLDGTNVSTNNISEYRHILKLAGPILISMSSFAILRMTDTAVLGHVGTEALSAVAIADLWTTSTFFLIQGNVASVFCGQAFGAGNYPLVGIWLQVSLIVVWTMGIIVIATWMATGLVLGAMGYSGSILEQSTYFAQVMALALPASITFGQVNKFLTAQGITTPEMVISMSGIGLNLVLNFVLVLGLVVPGWDGLGFPACPWVTTAVTWTTCIALIAAIPYFLKVKETWPGWKREHITWERIRSYTALYLPSALQMASSFWRFNCIGAMAASIGDVDVAVFNSSYKVIYISMLAVTAIGVASGIRVSIHLGANRPSEAKHVAWIGVKIALCFALCTGVLVMLFPRLFAGIFSQDEEVAVRFEYIAFFLGATIIFMPMSLAVNSILRAQGRTKHILYADLFSSWLVAVPTCYGLYSWRPQLSSVYAGVCTGYIALLGVGMMFLCRSDWQQLSHDALNRSEGRMAAIDTEMEAEEGANKA